MANQQHLAVLKQGVEVWNQWREKNPEIKPDLNGADLSGAALSGADLSRAYLIRIQALGTNFKGATLTGACIENWNINSETNLENVICDYVYLKSGQQERRPSDPNKNFAPGEFTKLFQKVVETVDLIFKDGIDWQAFLTSFQKLQVECGSDELSIQAIEKKSGGAFVIRVEVPADANKAEVEKSLKREYEYKLKAIEEKYRLQLDLKDEQLEFYRQQNACLMEIIKLKTSQPQTNPTKTSKEVVSDFQIFNERISKYREQSEELTQIVSPIIKDSRVLRLEQIASKDIEDIIHKYDSKIKQIEAKYKDEIDLLKREHDSKIKQLEEQFKAERQKYLLTSQVKEQQHNIERAKLQNNLRTLEEQYLAEIEDYRNKLIETVKDYEDKIRELEKKYQKEIEDKDEKIKIYSQHSADLKEITKLLASRPIQNVIDNQNIQDVNSRVTSMSKDSKYDLSNAKVYGFAPEAEDSNVVSGETVKDNTIVGTQHNYAPEKQDLAEAAAEIQQLLSQLSQTYPTTTLVEQAVVAEKAIQQIEDDPTLKQRVIAALKAGTIEAFMEIIDNPVVNVMRATLEAWQEGE